MTPTRKIEFDRMFREFCENRTDIIDTGQRGEDSYVVCDDGEVSILYCNPNGRWPVWSHLHGIDARKYLSEEK